MKITQKVKKILDNYESDCPGTKANLARILMHGRLGGSGKMVILPVDQGFEHGPDRSFAPNPDAFDPHYHYQLAIDAGLNAYAAPLGPLEAGADTFAGAIPTILKLNSANSLSTNKDQAVTASVNDALRLGCAAIGFTIYPGSEDQYEMIEEIRALAEEAKSVGLAVVMWSYPRGGKLDKAGETAMDVCAYAAHMAALLGAHIIKVKPRTNVLWQPEAKAAYEKANIDISTLAARIKHVMQATFAGRRIVVFSGGEAKDLEGLFTEIRGLRDGGANGSIIGRNTFPRPRDQALDMLDKIIGIYQGKMYGAALAPGARHARSRRPCKAIGQAGSSPPYRCLEIDVRQRGQSDRDRHDCDGNQQMRPLGNLRLAPEDDAMQQPVNRLVVHIQRVRDKPDLREDGIAPDPIEDVARLIGEHAQDHDAEHYRQHALLQRRNVAGAGPYRPAPIAQHHNKEQQSDGVEPAPEPAGQGEGCFISHN